MMKPVRRRMRNEDMVIVMLFSLVFLISLFYLCRYLNRSVYRYFTLLCSGTSLAIPAVCVLYYLFRTSISVDFISLWFVLTVFHQTVISLVNGFLPYMPFIVMEAYTWPLLILVFYDYFKEHGEYIIRVLSAISKPGMIIICLFAILNIANHLINFSGESVFYSYFVIAFLPLTYYFSGRNASIMQSVVSIVLMLISTKRAGFLISVIGFVLYCIVSTITDDNSKDRASRIAVYTMVLGVLVFVGMYAIERLDIQIFERLEKIADDGGSGRAQIWEGIMERYYQSSVFEKATGHGFHAVMYNLAPGGHARFAHNSYVEFLYDYGIIGLALLIVFILHIIVSTVRMIAKKKAYAAAMTYTIVSMLMLSFASYFFEQSVLILPFCLIWGICLGRFDRECMEEKDKYLRGQCKYFKK